MSSYSAYFTEDPEVVIEAAKMTSELFESLIRSNDRFPIPPAQITRFHANSIPDISVENYIARILKYSPFPSVCLYTVLIYMDRLASHHPNFTINSFNIHRVIITAITLAIKFHCDHLFTNRHYAKVGGISAKELMQLEFDMLTLLKFDIVVRNEEIEVYKQRLRKFSAQRNLKASISAARLGVETSPLFVTDIFNKQSSQSISSSANSSAVSLGKGSRFSFAQIPLFINTKNAISAFFGRDMVGTESQQSSSVYYGNAGSFSTPGSAVPSPVGSPSQYGTDRRQSMPFKKTARARRTIREASLPSIHNTQV